METESRGERTDGAAFAQTLESLKREGSNILLVGPGAQAAHERVCCRLLGELTDQSRYRLVVTASETTYRGHSCVSTGHDQATQLVEIDPVTDDDPSTPVANTGPSSASRRDTATADSEEARTAGQSLSALGTDVMDAVREIEAEADGLEPAELRVCVDSLVPILHEHPTEVVFRFLHMTTASVKRAAGMGHFHLPLDADHDAVNLLEPLFDATVEVRIREDGYEQRWNLRDSNAPSEWLEI